MEDSVNTKSVATGLFLFLAILTMLAAVISCTHGNVIIWITGQLILSLSCLFWFITLTEFARDKFFSSKTLNQIGGHIASFFCLVPFNQWKEMNAGIEPKAVPLKNSFIPPANVIAYSTKNFWNIKRLWGIFPEKKFRKRFISSMLVMNLFFLVVTPSINGFWKNFGPGYILFLIIVERLLINKKLDTSSVSGASA